MSPLTGDDPEAVRAIVDSIGAPITLGDLGADGAIRVFVLNRAAATFYGVPAARIEGRRLDEIGLRPEGRAEVIRRRYIRCIEAGETLHFRDFAPVETANGRRWVHTTMSPLVDEDRAVRRVMATLVDVTDLKLAEDHLAELLTKVLSGFIPICSACKKIRTKDDRWQPVEEYITTRSNALFSHGMCPTCTEEWFGPEPA